MTPEFAPNFVVAYQMLLHAEGHIISHVLEPETTMLDIVMVHNILEDAKSKVVQEYLPFRVQSNAQNIKEKK